jgi:hypothetical protein
LGGEEEAEEGLTPSGLLHPKWGLTPPLGWTGVEGEKVPRAPSIPYAILRPQMDKFGSFFAWVGLLAFLLAIPMSILSNLLTPRVQAWWAIQSKSRAIRRITKIQAKLDKLSNHSPFDALTHCLYYLLGTVVGLIAFVACGLIMFAITNNEIAALNNLILPAGTDLVKEKKLQFQLLILAFAMSIYAMLMFVAFMGNIRLVSPKAIVSLQKRYNRELTALKTKWDL